MDEVLQQLGIGTRPVNDPFFKESYEVCKVFQRKGVTIDDEEELCHEAIKTFQCYVPRCRSTFQTLLDYEMHYNSSHRYACTECKASRPNPRLLEIHIQETHDAFFKVLSEKQAMYQCYDSECGMKFNDPMERREHCIRVHKYPKKYRFDDTPRCSKEDELNKMEVDVDNKEKKKSAKVLLNKNQKSKMFTRDTTVSAACKSNDSVETVASPTVKTKTTSLVFIPRQVQKSFSKVLTNNQNKEKNVLESDTMMELADTLPS
ncbi:PREDICTED: zinc finger protein 511 [Vollenhovia emeryi]|uniref:zinc finger protein 511 n=1 Tax=Vollenhovia emeryi TaxID=411798 RepID=UPI0005F52D9F|nr:PREDICTED: zinc finger protein 511 [Vollenhovia emeryi]XP_011882623.1 PREDICTED: zinc finger protein 511 [Vollenhovia emeryi]